MNAIMRLLIQSPSDIRSSMVENIHDFIDRNTWTQYPINHSAVISNEIFQNTENLIYSSSKILELSCNKTYSYTLFDVGSITVVKIYVLMK